jgi:hypothetical protein
MAQDLKKVALIFIGAALFLPPLHAATATIPSGSLLSIELIDEIHSGKNKATDRFRARLLEGVWAQGQQALPPGLTLRGELLEVVASGRLKGQAKVRLTLRSLQIDATTYTLRTDTLKYLGDKHGGKNFGSLISGALKGLLFGVLLGGADGAAIGAGAGAGAGAVGGLINGKEDLIFKQGARLVFELEQAITVPVMKIKRQPAPTGKSADGPAAKPSS